MNFRWLLALIIAYAPLVFADDILLTNVPDGLTLTVHNDGSYRINAQKPNWIFEGIIPSSVDQISSADGSDSAGAYREVSLKSADGSAPQYSIRLYADRPAILFSERTSKTLASAVRFPIFKSTPPKLSGLSYLRQNFSPITFDLSGDAPWTFFDDNGNAFVLSPANHFMIANNYRSSDGQLSVGIESQVNESPDNFEFKALLVLTPGINAAYTAWGEMLTQLSGKTRPGNDADPVLSTLGYWTDNRSSYWYNYFNKVGYTGTLQAILKEFSDKGLKVGHLQLDSWWYVKGGDPNAIPPLLPSWEHANYAHGIYLYEAAPENFPQGLGAFQKSVSLPLVVHSRWIDPTSPYSQRYQLSNQVSIDPAYWDMVMKYLHDNGVETYEQDWLNQKGLPRLDKVADADLFLDNMATAAAKYGLNLQYCMALPRHFLQGSKYSNLLSIRTSGDGFEHGKWTQFLFGSQIASALGIWPWADVFFSQDRESVLLANLSGGIVGVGDRLSADSDAKYDYNTDWCAKQVNCRTVNQANLSRTMRGDGVIVKADIAAVPTDETYLSQFSPSQYPKAIVAMAQSYTGNDLAAAYVFAYSAQKNATADIVLDPKSFGFSGDVYLYRYFDGKGERIVAGQTGKATVNNQGSYFVVVPSDGLALLGDPNLFVTMGRKRLQVVDAKTQSQTLAVTFSKEENQVVLAGYSLGGKPQAESGGTPISVTYDTNSKEFRFTFVKPAALQGKGGAVKVSIYVN